MENGLDIITAVSAFFAVVTLVLSVFMFFAGKNYQREVKESVKAFSHTLFDDVTAKIFENIRNNQKLADRLKYQDLDEKRQLGDTLIAGGGTGDSLSDVQKMMKTVLKSVAESGDKSLFIESGSTLAFLSLALDRCQYLAEFNSNLKVKTNNVLIDSLLVYRDGVSVSLLEGTPKGRYGATYGNNTPSREPADLVKLWRSKKPKPGERPRKRFGPYDSDIDYIATTEQYNEMKKDIGVFFGLNPPLYLFMVTSKLSLIDGPHVGSFQNRDLKEIMYHYAREMRIPQVFIIYDQKIHTDSMGKKECLSVYGEDAIEMEDVERGGEGLGIVRFVRAIAEGDVTLFVSSKHPTGTNVPACTSGAGSLYCKIRDIAEAGLIDNMAIDVLESNGKYIRIFTKRFEDGKHPDIVRQEFYDNLTRRQFASYRIARRPPHP